MSSSESADQDDCWFAEIDCPMYFDFSAALQSPCSTDLLHNPPLHDFVYESDEESRRFFSSAEASPASPLPKRTQQPVLDPRYFGKPVYRHRPETSFEEFLRAYEARKKRTSRRSLRVPPPDRANAAGDSVRDQEVSPVAAPEAHGRYHNDASKRIVQQQQQQNDIDTDEEEEKDLTTDLKTPTLESIVTPVTLRRTPRKFTPSRVLKPTNIAKSLFMNSSTPSASPLRKPRPAARRSHSVATGSTDFLRSSAFGSASDELGSISSRHGTLDARTTPTLAGGLSKVPERTTPPGVSGAAGPSRNPSTTAANTSRLQIDRSVQPSPENRIGPPLRAARPSASIGSSESESPPMATSSSYRKQVSKSLRGVPPAQEATGKAVGSKKEIETSYLTSRSYRQQVSKSLRDPPSVLVASCDKQSPEIEDSDLVQRLQEHNRRLRKSGRHVHNDNAGPLKGYQGRTQVQHSLHRGRRAPGGQLPERGNRPQSQGQQPALPSAPLKLHSSAGIDGEEPRSLNDLLESENDRIIQERKEKLPERRRALQVSKENVLKRLERERLALPGQRKRASARVEFTSATAVDKLESEVSDDIDPITTEPIRKPPAQKRMQGFRTRAKSAGLALPSRHHFRNLNTPSSQETSAPRHMSTKVSVTGKVKASARQKRQEQRIENDLNSILSQHNTRVQNSRRGRA